MVFRIAINILSTDTENTHSNDTSLCNVFESISRLKCERKTVKDTLSQVPKQTDIESEHIPSFERLWKEVRVAQSKLGWIVPFKSRGIVEKPYIAFY